ncbi:MAG: type II toxin-antitoxin system VapC family toxin [Candidatus Latescibacteria bacterium]|nr:type II toxin-antitoxin system VapC family toxin [Candidatus Latescibacterota bacterium]
MPVIFVDTVGWIALLNRSDSLHAVAVRCFQSLGRAAIPLVTTSLVLVEVGNGFSTLPLRRLMNGLRQRLQQSRHIEVVHVDKALFERGWDLYAQRSDKEWGLVDCISFTLMRDRGMTQVVTNDHHFEQAGFVNLL